MQEIALETTSAELLCQDISPGDAYFSLLFCHTLLHVWDSSPVTEKKSGGFALIQSAILSTRGKQLEACVEVSLGRK